MGKVAHLAIDLGAESGRSVLGWIEDGALHSREVTRFPNASAWLPSGQHTNAPALLSRALEALDAAGEASSVSIDSWGVDYGLLDEKGALLGLPHHYRDFRTQGILKRLEELATRAEVYSRAGTQFMELNTLCQLLAARLDDPASLDGASHLLCTPDLINYWLTGRMAAEFTMAATTQCLDASTKRWNMALLDKLGIPSRLFCESIVMPGTRLGRAGTWSGGGAWQPLAKDVEVVAGASHDTSSAVASVSVDKETAWISSGTWSIMGVNHPTPVLTTAALEKNFTNEGAADGSFRLCKNIMGLWLVQECRRAWNSSGASWSYQDLADQAAEAGPSSAVFDADDDSLLRPGDMPAQISSVLRRHAQASPQGAGPMVRCILEAIALKYDYVLENLEQLIGRQISRIVVVGGGTQNRLLNQLTADCTGRTVVAGPVEATALGNIIVQMVAMGELESLAQGQELIAAATQPEVFHPSPAGRSGGAQWDEKRRVLREQLGT